MAETCPSGLYAAELVTAGGLTIAHPLEDPGATLDVPHSIIDWSGSEIDFAEWDALGGAIIGRLEKSWRLLKDWPKSASMPAGEWNDYVTRLNDVRERYSKIRKPWRGGGSSADPAWAWGYGGPDFAFDATDDIALLTQVITDAQCLREQIDNALARLGGTPERPGAGHTPAPEGLGLLGTALLVTGSIAIVGGAIWIATKVTQRRAAA